MQLNKHIACRGIVLARVLVPVGLALRAPRKSAHGVASLRRAPA